MECRKILDLVLIENECLDNRVKSHILGVIYLLSFANLELKKVMIMYFGRLYLMERMGFGGKWRGLMRACISSSYF